MIKSKILLLLAAAAVVLVPGTDSNENAIKDLVDYMVKHIKLNPKPDLNLAKFICDHEHRDPEDPLSEFEFGYQKELFKAIRKDPEHKKVLQEYEFTTFFMQPAALCFHSDEWKELNNDLKETNFSANDIVPVLFGDFPDGVNAAHIKKEFGMNLDDTLFVVAKDSQTDDVRKNPVHEKLLQEYCNWPLYSQPVIIGFHNGEWKKFSFKETDLTLYEVLPVVFGDIPEDAADIQKEFGMDSDDPLFVFLPRTSQTYDLEKI